MPCITDGPYEPPVPYEAMLCSACVKLESYGYNFAENPLLDKWWSDHKAEDQRREQHKARQDYLVLSGLRKPVSELTAEERSALRARGLI